MEEYQQQSEQSFEPSANNVDVAAPQTETQSQEISVTTEVANPNPVQDADTNARYADMRRKQELDQYRTQAETYQQQLDRTAKLAGYQSHDELIAALDEMEQQQQRQAYEDAGINPDLLNQAIEQHPSVQYARQLQEKQQQEQQFQQEANELFQEFPDLNPEQIPVEVWQLKESRGLSLLDSYLRVNYKNLAQQQEQAAIQKLQNNAASSPGSLGGGDVSHTTNVSKLSSSDFNSLVNQVLRGERKQL
jgi:hypothetical protein